MPNLTREDFIWDGYFWKTSVSLPVWSRFMTGLGPYGGGAPGARSDRRIEVVFAPEGRGESPLEESEIQLVSWPLENALHMQSAVLEGLLRQYPSLKEIYGGFVESRDMPPVDCVDGFLSLIDLRTINVHQLETDAAPYVGFAFDCTWDREHGLGVLMHGTRVVEIGEADTAILLWIAERDAGVRL